MIRALPGGLAGCVRSATTASRATSVHLTSSTSAALRRPFPTLNAAAAAGGGLRRLAAGAILRAAWSEMPDGATSNEPAVDAETDATTAQAPAEQPPAAPPPAAAAAPAGKQISAAAAALFVGAMPKEEIGALRFLHQYPEYDGRGVVIAIFDTGVDPGAAGLQTTPDGRPKILDVIDCTGSGDVDTSTVVESDSDGVIKAASGRQLRLNPSWVNPDGKWHVGCRRLFDLVPKQLQNRMKGERRKAFDEAQRLAVAAAATDVAAAGGKPAVAAAAGQASKAELEDRLKYLQELAKGSEDPGPIIDAVVWHDGSTWRAALDTSDLHPPGSDRGLLAGFEPMTDFKLERRFGTFSDLDACNYVLNVYDQGNTLSIVVDAGAHGTHVAGITAAFFPGDPDSNGVAPGAQIISCKIGDSRLGSMETGTGLTRGLAAVLQHKAHLINMSYGEPSSTPNAGRFIELASEAVHKHGVIFVASAGNAGPALTTVGAPGGTSSALLAIGAYVTPALAAAGHSLREPLAGGQQYTWSSRGPTQDGHIGVTFSAPGGAIAPVPCWTTQRRQLMNGTSMASPNACGGVALLLSGLLAQGQATSPARVRRAVENTCLALGGGAPDAVLTYGRGLLQVDAAFDYLQRSVTVDTPDIRYEVSVSGASWAASSGGKDARGVYLREPHEAAVPRAFNVSVQPLLHEDAPTSDKLLVEDQLLLTATQPWLAAPTALLLHHNGRGFELRVDASQLPPGLHYGEVQGLDAGALWRGPLFRVPVTVVRPLAVPRGPEQAASFVAGTAAAASGAEPSATGAAAAPADGGGGGNGGELLPYTLQLGQVLLSAGAEERVFLAAPEGATWAELHLKAGPYDTPKTFLVRATQLAPAMRYTDTEHRQAVTLSPGSEFLVTFKVAGGATLELTLAQFWSSLGDSSLGVELSFHGVTLEQAGGGGGALALDGAGGPRQVEVRAPLRRQWLKPDAKLDRLGVALRPTDAVLAPLVGDARDALPAGRVLYQLVLSYKFMASEAGKFTPTVPLTNRFLYDSPLEAQMLMLFDADKRLLYTGDAYPEEVSLAKGDYSMRLLLRHDSFELLEKLKGACVVLERRLEPAVQLPVYTRRSDALAGGSTAGDMYLNAGDRATLFLGPLPDDKLPKDATQGRVLTGSLALGQLRRGSGAAPHKFGLTYVVPPAKLEAKKDSGKADGEDATKAKPPSVRVAEALRDAKLKLLAELRSASLTEAAPEAEAYAGLEAELAAEWPGHLPLLLERLRRSAASAAKAGKAGGEGVGTAGLGEVVAAADVVAAAVDVKELAAFLALRAPDEEAGNGGGSAAGAEGAGGGGGGDEGGVVADAAGAEAAAAGVAVAAAAPQQSYKALKAVMDERKAALLEALSTKLGALLDSAEAGEPASGEGGVPSYDADIRATLAALRQWVDTGSDVAYAMLHARAEARNGRLCSALRALDKVLSSDDPKAPPRKEAAALKATLLGRLGWLHWQARELAMAGVRFPERLPPL